MPNGIDLGPAVFTQWRTQQGVGGSTASGHRPNTDGTILGLQATFREESTGILRNLDRFVLSEILGNAASQNNA